MLANKKDILIIKKYLLFAPRIQHMLGQRRTWVIKEFCIFISLKALRGKYIVTLSFSLFFIVHHPGGRKINQKSENILNYAFAPPNRFFKQLITPEREIFIKI